MWTAAPSAKGASASWPLRIGRACASCRLTRRPRRPQHLGERPTQRLHDGPGTARWWHGPGAARRRSPGTRRAARSAAQSDGSIAPTAVAIQQQRDDHLRVERRPAMTVSPVAAAKRTQIQCVHRVQHRPPPHRPRAADPAGPPASRTADHVAGKGSSAAHTMIPTATQPTRRRHAALPATGSSRRRAEARRPGRSPGQCDDAWRAPHGLSPGRLSSCLGGGSWSSGSGRVSPRRGRCRSCGFGLGGITLRLRARSQPATAMVARHASATMRTTVSTG